VLDQMLSTFGGAGGDSLCDTASRILHPGRIDKPTVAIGTDQRPNFAVLDLATVYDRLGDEPAAVHARKQAKALS
jgi:hypothetical protein